MRYEFVVNGAVSETTLEAFPELSATVTPMAHTSLYGPVRDSSDMTSLLARFADLGLEVVELRLLPD